MIADELLQVLSREFDRHPLGSRKCSFRELDEETRELLKQPGFDWRGNVRKLKAFLRAQVRLRRHEPHGHLLRIPREVLEHWFPEVRSSPKDVSDTQEQVPLSAWGRSELRMLRERQLLAYLRFEASRSGIPASLIDKDWVSRVCSKAFGVRNASEKLRSGIRKNCGELARLLASGE